MATACAAIEPVFLPLPLIVPDETADPDGPDELPNLRQQARQSNLGISILLSAVQDYRGSGQRAHLSAALFLFPVDEHYRTHLKWCCDIADLAPVWLRQTLDRLRPQWDQERERCKQWRQHQVP